MIKVAQASRNRILSRGREFPNAGLSARTATSYRPWGVAPRLR